MGILKKNLNQNQKIYQSDNFQLLQPWSVPILKTNLPENIFKSFYNLSEDILKDPNPRLAGPYLAGQIENERYINLNLLDSYNIKTYLVKTLQTFIIESRIQMLPFVEKERIRKNSYDIEIKSIWIVSQKPGEYNPLHYHEGMISGVLYLKIPEKLWSIKDNDCDGSLIFNNTALNKNFSRPILQIEPKVGDLYIFGSQQQHAVYPYRSNMKNAERRSISFNAFFREKPLNCTPFELQSDKGSRLMYYEGSKYELG